MTDRGKTEANGSMTEADEPRGPERPDEPTDAIGGDLGDDADEPDPSAGDPARPNLTVVPDSAGPGGPTEDVEHDEPPTELGAAESTGPEISTDDNDDPATAINTAESAGPGGSSDDVEPGESAGIGGGAAFELGDPAAAGGGEEGDAARGAASPGEPGEHFREAAKRAIEAIVMVAEEPMAPHLLAQLLEISPVVVDALCRELAESYENEDRGFQLVRVAGGWRYQSHPDQAPYIERLVLEGQTSKLSAAALETLAIVAYKQPISRAQVAAIRGVSADGVMRTLQQRGFITEVGKDPGPGQATMFGTSARFLQKLGLNSLDELPPLGDFVPNAEVVEQLERGLRPDRQALRPDDFAAPGPTNGAAETNGSGHDDLGDLGDLGDLDDHGYLDEDE